MSKPKRSDLTKAKYEILAFREFETPQTMEPESYLAMVFCGHSVSGTKTKSAQTVRHIAIVKVRRWIFNNAITVLIGEAAQSLVDQAKAEGVYEYGDPGEHDRDQRVRSTWASSSSGNTWYYDVTNSSTTGSQRIMYWSTAA